MSAICLSAGPDDGGVQRLVHVGLGTADVVLELVVDRLPQRVDQPQGLVALGYRVEDDAKGDEVVDLLEGETLGLHFGMDAEVVFAAPEDLGLQARRRHLLPESVPDRPDVLLALRPRLGDEVIRAYSSAQGLSRSWNHSHWQLREVAPRV